MKISYGLEFKNIRRVYISGQITGLDINYAKRNFASAVNKVIYDKKGDLTVNPFDIKPFFGIKKWLFYMIADIKAQRKCTHTAFQQNWKESKGAVIEYFFAKFIFKHQIIFL